MIGFFIFLCLLSPLEKLCHTEYWHLTVLPTGNMTFPALTQSNIHSVLDWSERESVQLPHTNITALIFLPSITDDDALLQVAAVAQTRGQRLLVTRLQSHVPDLGVGHETRDGAVLACSHQDAIHHGALERIVRVWRGDMDRGMNMWGTHGESSQMCLWRQANLLCRHIWCCAPTFCCWRTHTGPCGSPAPLSPGQKPLCPPLPHPPSCEPSPFPTLVWPGHWTFCHRHGNAAPASPLWEPLNEAHWGRSQVCTTLETEGEKCGWCLQDGAFDTCYYIILYYIKH